MDHEIIVWLNSGQDYTSGLLLHEKYARNPNLGRILRVGGATGKNRLTLSYELGKIAKHLVISQNTPTPKKPLVMQVIPKEEHLKHSKVTGIETLRSEQKMIYKMLDNLHAILPYREIQERRDIAFQILELDDRLMEITERIAHYEKHGVIPPAPVTDEPRKVSDLNDAELIQRQMNVRTYITRYKRLVADSKSLKTMSRNQELLEKFQLELDDINKRLGK
jgi:hypothetical protein